MSIKREDVERIWEEVKANSAKLAACPRPHEFGGPDSAKIGGKRTCSKCGGWAKSVDAVWYEQGLRDARQ